MSSNSSAEDVKTSSNARRIVILAGLSVSVFYYVFWLIFVGTFASHELLIGIIGAALATVGLAVVVAYDPSRFSPTMIGLLSLWRLPWYLISGTWEITVVAAKDLLGIQRAKSLFRVVDFKAGDKEDPHATARRVLAVTYTTAAPNFIVLGINTSDQKLLFHQIERSSVPKMTQELGAQG
jgi:multisubunit Na+/H+ antiporter MnhE subunit